MRVAGALLFLLVLLAGGCADQPTEPPPPPDRTLWRVRADGSGDFTDIQEAVNASNSGDTILVGPGHYASLHSGQVAGIPRLAVFIVLFRSIRIIAEEGPDSTIVGDLSTTDYAIVCGNAGSTSISGFDVRGGGNGGILLHRTNGRITGNRVTGATTALRCEQGTVLADSNAFLGNREGIIAAGTTLTTSGNRIEDCELKAISCTQGTHATLVGDLLVGSGNANLAVSESDADATRLLIAGGTNLGVDVFASRLTLRESTVVGNTGIGIVLSGVSDLEADRVIITLSGGCGTQLAADGSTQQFTCSDVWANGLITGGPCTSPTGNGNFSRDPVFCDLAAEDYTLRATSPCSPDSSGGCGLIGALGVACP
jgi:hypothetical protein